MRDQGFEHIADYQPDAMHDSTFESCNARDDDAPRPSEVLYDISVAVAAFLGVAVLAQLLLLVIS